MVGSEFGRQPLDSHGNPLCRGLNLFAHHRKQLTFHFDITGRGYELLLLSKAAAVFEFHGNDDALDDAQKRGFGLFVGKAACVACHNGALLSDEKYHNLGVPPAKEWETHGVAQVTFRYELYSKGLSEKHYRKFKDDPGLYFRTKQTRDLGKFRTPSLRYTKYTAPYMHNGQIQTLKDVVQFYNQGGGENEFADTKMPLKPLGLSEQEVDDLVAFIESMSGARILMEYPQLPPYASLDSATE